MRRSNVSSLSVIALVVVAMAFIFGYLRVEAQSPVGSGFTYQGRMFDASNAPVQGTCDLALRLYDHDSGGAQIGATVTITSVAMTDGYFDVAPDFGAASFNGEARWLEVDAACPPGAGATTFPRQAINVVPYALYALNSAITSTVYVTESLYYTPTYHLQGWDTITGTPGTYTPTAHTQDWGTITDQPAEYTPTAHTQGWTTITDAPSTYTPTAHTQDWTTIFGAPGTYTPTAHTQDWTTITGQPSTYTPTAHTQDWTTILNQPSTYTPTAHTQAWSTITSQPSTYTPTAHTQDWTTILNQPSTYTPTAHTQEWTTITGSPGTYTPTAHTQAWSTITSQPSTYTPTAHTQDWTTITGSQLTLTNTTGPSTMTANVAATTGIVTLNATGTTPAFVITPPVTFTAAPICSTLTAGRVVFAGTSKELVDDSGLMWDNTNKQLGINRTPGYSLDVETSSAITNSYVPVLSLRSKSTGTAAAGFGPAIFFQGYDEGNTSRYMAYIASKFYGTPSTRSSGISFWPRNAATFFEAVVIDNAGNVGIGTNAPTGALLVLSDAFTTKSALNIVRTNAVGGGLQEFNPEGALSAAHPRFYLGLASSRYDYTIGTWDGSTATERFTILPGGNVGIGTNAPNNFKLQVAGNVGPNATNTYDLGSAENYWATIHYHTLTSHSLSVFSTTVTLQNGKEVSCLDALYEIKGDPTKKVKGIQHMDYATIPSVAFNAAPITGFDHGTMTAVKDGEDGADLDMMVSLMLCADKELDAKSNALDNRISDLEKRMAVLEQGIR